MTIPYTEKASNLLGRWKGSVWKTVWKELLAWLIIWYAIYFALKFALTDSQKLSAGKVVAIFDSFCDSLPLVFILGFYVGQVVTRWWNQVMALAWPDDIVAVVNSCMYDGDHLKAIRETVARWVVLSEAMVMRKISSRIRKRFPKLENLLDAGLMTKQELDIVRRVKCKNTRWQLPLDWIIGKVIFPSDIDSVVKVAFVGTVNSFRKSMRELFAYDWINIPLVYTQTVTIVVYGYFALALVGHQYTDVAIDLYAPWLSILQFVFFVGWLNVARDLLQPFGEDDDDLELNCILDRHAAVAYSMATEVREESPDIVFDQKLRQEIGQKLANHLTYSVASTKTADHPPKLRAQVIMENPNEETQVTKRARDDERNGILGKLHLIKRWTPFNYF